MELRREARRRDLELPGEDSLKRMFREWFSGRREPSELYAGMLAVVLGAPISAAESGAGLGCVTELRERLEGVEAALDQGLVNLFESQTQNLRLLDRKIGANRLLAQTEAHVAQMMELLRYSITGPVRPALATAAAEAASLAAWQALDLGRSDKAWSLYAIARQAAFESESAVTVAHVTGESAFCLLEIGRCDDAYSLISSTRTNFKSKIPILLRSWLWAAEAEAAAASGRRHETLQALEEAERALPGTSDEALPFLSLNSAHLARWRGHCLARIGHDEAVKTILLAVSDHDPQFARAKSALLCDLATAYSVRGERDAALGAAQEAERLAVATSSVRQQRRISQLLSEARVATT